MFKGIYSYYLQICVKLFSGLSWSNRSGLSGAAAKTTFVWGLPCKSTCQTRRQVKNGCIIIGILKSMVQLNDKLCWEHFVAFQDLISFVAKICNLVPVWNLWCEAASATGLFRLLPLVSGTICHSTSRLQNLCLSSAVASRLISLGAAFRDTLVVVVPEKWLCHCGHVNRFC